MRRLKTGIKVIKVNQNKMKKINKKKTIKMEITIIIMNKKFFLIPKTHKNKKRKTIVRFSKQK